jgi:hypothetical protein
LVFDENEPEYENNGNEFQYLDEDYEDSEDSNTERDDSESEASSSTTHSSPIKKAKSFISFDEKRRAVEFWESSQNKRKLTSVQKSFRFITSERQLYKFKKQVAEAGGRNDKLKIIADHTLNEFKSAKKRQLIVHDYDLKRWALNKQKEIKVEGFKASHNLDLEIQECK